MEPGGAWRGFEPWFLGTLRRSDLGGSEGRLKGPGRREVLHGQAQLASQFHADDLGPPVGVSGFQGAGPGDHLRGRRRPTAVLVTRAQAVVASLPEGAPDLPDGVVREAQLESDLGEFLAVEAASHDLLADRHR